MTNIPAGSYEIEFEGISNHATPDNISFAAAAGEAISKTGTYIRLINAAIMMGF